MGHRESPDGAAAAVVDGVCAGLVGKQKVLAWQTTKVGTDAEHSHTVQSSHNAAEPSQGKDGNSHRSL